MPSYENQPCIVCGERFKAADDIVTCPECGTPYHRACWMQSGKCINQELHESGVSWVAQRKEKEHRQRQEERFAEELEQAEARERGDSPSMINGSLYDGVRMDPNDPCIGLNPEESLGDVTIREAAAFIRTNNFYYLPLFRLMKRTGKKITVNLLSLLFPQFYFANRKMWGYALLAVLLNTVLGIPAVIKAMNTAMGIELPWIDINTAAFHSVYRVSMFAYFLISMIWCLFGNYLYYRFALRRIRSIKKQTGSPETVCTKLQSAGGTSLVNVILVIIIQFAVSFTTESLLMIVR